MLRPIIHPLAIVSTLIAALFAVSPVVHAHPHAHPPILPYSQTQSLTLRIDRVDYSAHPAVHAYVTVRDANGVPVPDLALDHFEVIEDRIPPEPRPLDDVTALVHEETPASVVLVIDISGSMKGQPLADAQAAATRLVDRMQAGDQVALLAFRDAVPEFPALDPARELDFTSDQAALYQVIDGLTAGGNTPLYDAAFKAVRLAARQPAGRRAVLLLTDGQDEVAGQPKGSGSKVANEDSAILEANRRHIPVFSIGLGEARDEAYLKRLATQTGGEYQATPDSGQLSDLFSHVLDRLKQQYRITYQSAVQPDGQMHKIEVVVKLNGVTAEDEAEWGPIGQAGQPVIVPATALATAAPPAPTSSPIPPPAPATFDWAWVFVGGGCLLLLLFAGLGVVWRVARSRRITPRYCMKCGYQLQEGETYCPHCGPGTKTFQRPS